MLFWGWSMDWSVSSPRIQSVVGVHGPEVSVFGFPKLPHPAESSLSNTAILCSHRYFAFLQTEQNISKFWEGTLNITDTRMK